MTDELQEAIPDENSEIEDIVRYARKAAKLMIETIEKEKSKTNELANARARDARTLNELVRTLERLEALEQRCRAEGRKTTWRHDSELKAALVRRIDKLLESATAAAGAGKHRGQRSGSS